MGGVKQVCGWMNWWVGDCGTRWLLLASRWQHPPSICHQQYGCQYCGCPVNGWLPGWLADSHALHVAAGAPQPPPLDEASEAGELEAPEEDANACEIGRQRQDRAQRAGHHCVGLLSWPEFRRRLRQAGERGGGGALVPAGRRAEGGGQQRQGGAELPCSCHGACCWRQREDAPTLAAGDAARMRVCCWL